MTLFVNPNLWGPSVWDIIDKFIAPLPDILISDQIEAIMCLYKSLRVLLPCNSCKTSYNIFSSEKDTDIENGKNFETRKKVIEFNFRLRNKVNNKLGKIYYINLKYYTIKFDKYLCSEKNTLDYLATTIQEFSFIPDKYLNKCLAYIHKNKKHIKSYVKGLTVSLMETFKTFIDNIKESDFSYKNKTFREWVDRNKKCRKYYNNILEYQLENNLELNEAVLKKSSDMANLLYLGGFFFNTFEFDTIDFLK